jgi:GMP reductase
MSSQEAQEMHYGGAKDYAAPEGCCSRVKAKGPVKDVFVDILGGLRSACAYVGADSLKDLSKCTTFVRVNQIR